MWAKGFSAEDTRAAFSRAAELAAKSDDFSARFTAREAQFRAASTEGELRFARELALINLREAEAAGRLWEASVVNNQLGLVAYWQGDFIEARTRCERALDAADASPGPNDSERFGDRGTYASSFLAATMWQLGEVERARELIEAANRRAAELGHAPSMAHPLQAKFFLEFLRGDTAAALAAAESLEALGRAQGMRWWREVAETRVVRARARLLDPAAGAAELQATLAAIERRGKSMSRYWSMIAQLAELELRTLGPGGALARIDEALAFARQVESRSNLPFAHILRGEILYKLDQTNPAPAEGAFRTAIAIAKEQGARSWGLRAAVPLAKLYQSTGRLGEAHAVLAPALEGFAPTPEMPEIAEAQTLLERLAHGGDGAIPVKDPAT